MKMGDTDGAVSLAGEPRPDQENAGQISRTQNSYVGHQEREPQNTRRRHYISGQDARNWKFSGTISAWAVAMPDSLIHRRESECSERQIWTKKDKERKRERNDRFETRREIELNSESLNPRCLFVPCLCACLSVRPECWWVELFVAVVNMKYSEAIHLSSFSSIHMIRYPTHLQNITNTLVALVQSHHRLVNMLVIFSSTSLFWAYPLTLPHNALNIEFWIKKRTVYFDSIL